MTKLYLLSHLSCPRCLLWSLGQHSPNLSLKEGLWQLQPSCPDRLLIQKLLQLCLRDQGGSAQANPLRDQRLQQCCNLQTGCNQRTWKLTLLQMSPSTMAPSCQRLCLSVCLLFSILMELKETVLLAPLRQLHPKLMSITTCLWISRLGPKMKLRRQKLPDASRTRRPISSSSLKLRSNKNWRG